MLTIAALLVFCGTIATRPWNARQGTVWYMLSAWLAATSLLASVVGVVKHTHDLYNIIHVMWRWL